MANNSDTILAKAFEIIHRLIVELHAKQERWISRDEIAQAMKDDAAGRKLLRERERIKGASTIDRAGNLVDWFSASLTSKTPNAKEYQKAFRRKHDKVWHYQPQNNEFGVDGTILNEGKALIAQGVRYERNPHARKECVSYFGALCKICGFSFEAAYGPAGRGHIHVHHIRPLSERGKSYEVDPIKDLVPVCANCHAIIHRRSPAYSIEEVKRMLRRQEKTRIRR